MGLFIGLFNIYHPHLIPHLQGQASQ